MVEGGGAFGIQECGLGCDVYGSADGGDAESDGIFSRQRRMNLDGSIVGGKTLHLHFHTIAGKGQIADDQKAGIVSGEGAVELDGVAGEIDGGLNGLGVWPGNLET